MTYKPSGLIEITGDHDAGKTLASLFVNYEYGVPLKKIAFFHDDTKHPGYEPKDFGLFVDLVTETEGMKLFEYRKFILDKIDKIKPKQYQAIVFDTWPKFGESLRNYVVSHRYEFRNKDEFIMQHDLKVVGAQTWKDAHNHEALMASKIASLADCFIVTSHLKDDYKAGVKTGKQIDELGKAWNRICNLRLWLRHNKDGGVPVVLVLKRIHNPGLDKKGMATTIDVLPRKIKPFESEKSIWEAISRYWDNPVGNRPLEDYEKPSEFELSILDGILTKDQKEVWQAEIREKNRQETNEQEFFVNQGEDVKAFINKLAQSHNGLSPLAKAKEILPEVRKDYPDYTQSDIIKILMENE